MLRNPMMMRVGMAPYGSAFLATSQRLQGGSTFTSDVVNVDRFYVKTFGFRGGRQGSFFVDAAFGSSSNSQFFTLDQGTIPASFGSIRTASTTEGYGVMRARVIARVGGVGSYSVFFGGQPIAMGM